jgi:hypothetical protein
LTSFLDFSLVTLTLCFSVVSTTFCLPSGTIFVFPPISVYCLKVHACLTEFCQCFLPEGACLPYGVFSCKCLLPDGDGLPYDSSCKCLLPEGERLPYGVILFAHIGILFSVVSKTFFHAPKLVSTISNFNLFEIQSPCRPSRCAYRDLVGGS